MSGIPLFLAAENHLPLAVSVIIRTYKTNGSQFKNKSDAVGQVTRDNHNGLSSDKHQANIKTQLVHPGFLQVGNKAIHSHVQGQLR